MPKRQLNKKTLDSIGRKLFESDCHDDKTLEMIVAKPSLFSGISKKLGDYNQVQKLDSYPVLSFQRIAMALASASIIGAVALAVWFLPGNISSPTEKVQIPVAVPDVARSEVPPHPLVGKLSADRALITENTDKNLVSKSRAKRSSKVANNHQSSIPEREFYSISVADDPWDAADGGRQIIRVEMSRSSLFALGANIPLENGPDTLMADLVIGSDGKTRAIRVLD